jgi:hypothetical protein
MNAANVAMAKTALGTDEDFPERPVIRHYLVTPDLIRGPPFLPTFTMKKVDPGSRPG